MRLIILIALIIFLVLVGPFLLIWSLNTLFPVLAIPYSLETWAAVAILSGVFKTTVKANK